MPVGVEPVAVAAHSDSEVWVVNHLSPNSVSVVKIDDDANGGVVRTLLVGDEPRDVVFAGRNHDRAFITTAHRGQNIPFDPQLTTPGVGRADVWIFDAKNLGSTLGGDPLTIVNLFSDTPRALAVTPDGHHVYAAGFHSGNRTTSISLDAFQPGGAGPPPGAAHQRRRRAGARLDHHRQVRRPALGRRGGARLGRQDRVQPARQGRLRHRRPGQPACRGGRGGEHVCRRGHHPLRHGGQPRVRARLRVQHRRPQRRQSFEGPGIFAGHSASIRGHFAENHITILDPSGTVTPRHLNKHINYGSCCAPIPNAENAKSLALPTGLAVSDDGQTLYVAAMGSSKIGFFKTATLENDTFVPSTANQITVTGGGPTGLVLDTAGHRLYALTRFDDSISIIDTKQHAEVGHVAMHNPEPPTVTTGRRFLYDASFSSAHGDSACATCHVFGDDDSLAWNLGNPDGTVLNDPGPFATPLFGLPTSFHPMKGPMITQSLRGLENGGPMHWRGDRTGGNDAPTAQPDSGSFDERGRRSRSSRRGSPICWAGRARSPRPTWTPSRTTSSQLRYPPNPIRNLDNSLTPRSAGGARLLRERSPVRRRVLHLHHVPHALDPQGNPGTDAPQASSAPAASRRSTPSRSSSQGPQLRNLYQKVGMFGMAPNSFFISDPFVFTGDQVRGFGFVHDGSLDTVHRFHGSAGFSALASPSGFPLDAQGSEMRSRIEAYIMAFRLEPRARRRAAGDAHHRQPRRRRGRIAPCSRRAQPRASAISSPRAGSARSSWASSTSATATSSPIARMPPPIDEAWLRTIGTIGGRALTFTCVPPGEGVRVALDRDQDGYFDGDEHDAGSDPCDKHSHP